MRVHKLHSWNLTPREAARVRSERRGRWEGCDRFAEGAGKIAYVAGCDAAYFLGGSQALGKRSRQGALREANRAIAGVIVYRFPDMIEVERVYAQAPLRFPYVPGLLSFRECPALLAAFRKLKHEPDVIFCDGQGIAHPRRFGLACHLGGLLDRPTSGCAKSRLIGEEREPGQRAGNWTALTVGSGGKKETIGAVLRTRDGVRPIYVSQGHRVTLETAIRLTLAVCDGSRIPRPTREADRYVGELKRAGAGSPRARKEKMPG
ncbi:MAG: endonuclease V [Acidobacteriia bacterium]|nr:endonuclease V [Terriglobia bacterium]